MATGISISSINRIKELAEEKKYAEALEILDTQDLDKSINPQFLRISGEVFRENKRYYDSRKILLKAHKMAPQGLRIIAELIQLYLELGYFKKAQRYYEQYTFYTTPEDNQKEYVEYIMKKGIGADVKELASILIPILERLPEDRWNFESVLLYDKLDRKDKALDESRYILENFKDSIYVQPAIDYIEDKLDVDAYFYVYPKQEIEEDTELFGDLMEEEEELLKADHLRMYPPDAKIMVEAEDREGIDIKPAKEKKTKKKKKSASEKTTSNKTDEKPAQKKASKKRSAKDTTETAEVEQDNHQNEISSEHEQSAQDVDGITSTESGNSDIVSEEQIKQEREAALEKLLSKRTSTEHIKESAKQAVKAAREIDAEKAKEQVKSVAKTVKGNVKKATDVLGEAVGVKATEEEHDAKGISNQNEIVDGIIESVLEPPKKPVGQVVTNEELDALIPDSLEAMSTAEIAELEAKKAEAERLELEALEAQLKLEEEKKAKNRMKKEGLVFDSDVVPNLNETDNKMVSVSGKEFIQLKERFLAIVTEEEEEKPLESLGYIKIVQSDVDAKMEEEIPDAANILHQMIDNKEFYTGEDSTKFESKASYENHGFEIEDYSFETFEPVMDDKPTHAQLYDNLHGADEDVPTVEIIYAQEDVIEFNEIVPEEVKEQPEVLADIEEVKEQPEALVDAEEVEEQPEALVDVEEVKEQPEALVDIEEVTEQPETVVEQENEWTQYTVESETTWMQDTVESVNIASDTIAEAETAYEPVADVVIEEQPEEYISEPTKAEMPYEPVEDVVIEEQSEEYVSEPTKAEIPYEPAEDVVIEKQPEEYISEPAEAETAYELAEDVVIEEQPEEYGEMAVVADSGEEDVMAAELSEQTGEVEAVIQKTERRHLLRINILITEDMTKKLMDLKESR
ncbi:MAG: hypothetical protein NC347_00120 [Clostridium sp.]|nr:hypothetical protein [Clostridium sp.]